MKIIKCSISEFNNNTKFKDFFSVMINFNLLSVALSGVDVTDDVQRPV